MCKNIIAGILWLLTIFAVGCANSVAPGVSDVCELGAQATAVAMERKGISKDREEGILSKLRDGCAEILASGGCAAGELGQLKTNAQCFNDAWAVLETPKSPEDGVNFKKSLGTIKQNCDEMAQLHMLTPACKEASVRAENWIRTQAGT